MLYEASPLMTDPLPANLTQLEYGEKAGKYFLKTSETDFDTITRPANWYVYASTLHLRELLAKPDSKRQPAVATAFHMRLTRPIVGLLLVLMGLAVILRDQNRHVFISVGLDSILTGVFYAVMLGCKYLGEADVVAPALAAWLPVFIFGPVTLALFDAVHT
jgi:lipopolysaccharide export system permease protein